MIDRRTFVLAAMASAGTAGAQQAYPAKPITFVIPWGAGGANDVLARTLEIILSDQGMNIIVENLPGAAGAIGMTKVANAAPDGYTLGMGTSTTLSAIAMRKTPLKNSQFDHLARLCVDPLLLVVPAQSPSTTLDDYLGHMKKTGVAIGANGDFNTTHVLAAMTARSMNARFVYVPYAGGPKILSDLMGGHLESAILKPSDCRSQLEAKTLRPLAVFAKQRLAGFPDVPTLAEKGVDVFGMGPIVQMSYLAAPAGLPAPIKSRLITAVRAALRDPRYAKLAAQNAFVVDDLTGDALTAEVTGVGNAISSIATKVIQ